jgi:hypothetical protein
MNTAERELMEALVGFERLVGSGVPGPKPGLGEALARIDAASRRLPVGTPPDLLHYLGKRSYEKARLWLEGKDPEQGVCPH